jgi:ubiquinone/menaquinone biosynthesis C-methylase UbiE
MCSVSSRASSPPAAPEAGEYFDERAERYDRAYDTSSGYALRSRMDVALRLLGSGPGEILDVGMGPGRLLAELAQRGWTVSGIDASSEMVAVARDRLPDSAARLAQGTIESLPFADSSFDAVVATGVLEYAEVGRALPELARILRPGGLAVVSYPNPGNLYGLWKTRAWYPLVRAARRIARKPPLTFPQGSRGSRAVTPERFRARLAAAGLRPEQVEHTSYLVVPAPVDELLPRLTEAFGRRLEGSGPTLSRRLAGQVLYTARRPA